ncbi:hypothetical protein KAOT1_06947 [Kordia algicida OT-1]|uniref:Uncharacterized protein n=1 Tax=Kordia algicida OT-1 TaxID=391587 RepID=A9E5N2_9FLAO|nr:hypothetical protein KAOT1_06947 [Kordia algicida OT-1]
MLENLKKYETENAQFLQGGVGSDGGNSESQSDF